MAGRGVAGELGQVEAFLFATRLTRITRQLNDRSIDEAVTQVSRAVPDWAGGTRIGETLRSFNFQWSRRIPVGRGVVLIISDGWDRGEPELLSREMARLQRSCRRLIWLNPLLGSPTFEPLTQGLQAALPYVDNFLPVHNFDSLQALAHHLNDLEPRKQLSSYRIEAAQVQAGIPEIVAGDPESQGDCQTRKRNKSGFSIHLSASALGTAEDLKPLQRPLPGTWASSICHALNRPVNWTNCAACFLGADVKFLR